VRELARLEAGFVAEPGHVVSGVIRVVRRDQSGAVVRNSRWISGEYEKSAVYSGAAGVEPGHGRTVAGKLSQLLDDSVEARDVRCKQLLRPKPSADLGLIREPARRSPVGHGCNLPSLTA